MTRIIIILLLLLQPLSNSLSQDLLYKFGKPTSTGIDKYIKQNEEQFSLDYQKLCRDTIYNDIYIVTQNFKKYFGKDYNKNTLAFNTIYEGSSCEITVNNEERYSDYDYNLVKHRENYVETNYFVRATVMHEISHYYIMQLIQVMRRQLEVEVNPYYYYTIMQFPNLELQYGAKFIEEGICEYLKYKWELSPELTTDYKPKSRDDIIKAGDKFEILYGYSSQFVKEYLDCSIKQYGRPRNAIMVLLHNRPPNYQEILNPRLYFERLSIY